MANKPTKLYILVRKDLSGSQLIVQTCHALANLIFRYGNDP